MIDARLNESFDPEPSLTTRFTGLPAPLVAACSSLSFARLPMSAKLVFLADASTELANSLDHEAALPRRARRCPPGARGTPATAPVRSRWAG